MTLIVLGENRQRATTVSALCQNSDPLLLLVMADCYLSWAVPSTRRFSRSNALIWIQQLGESYICS